MKASLKLIQYLVGKNNNNLPIDEQDIVERIGSQIGAVEEVNWLKPIYEPAIIVKITSVKKIAGSDHLSLCVIDDNKTVKEVDRLDSGCIQVVCGAANVREGLVTVWLPPNSIVPATITKTPLKLTVRKIMGEDSNGMLASAAELAIGDNHQGIVELASELKIGTSLVEYLNLDDRIIDIENKMFTHRPDLFGQIGIAREICGIYNKPFVSPEWYQEDKKLRSTKSGRLNVVNQLPLACPRFMAVCIDGIKIEPSPFWLQSYLSRVGIRPVNNIVDITNYVMMATGQPLHAYDLAKIKDNDDRVDLLIREPKENEELKLIDGSTIKLEQPDIVVANKQQALGLGGIMGGFESALSETTSSIVLECANFDMYTIRKASMAHGIFSEAVTRFNKGQSPWQCPAVLAYAYDLIQTICKTAEISSEVVDELSANLVKPKDVSVSLELINTYLGINLPNEVIMTLLNNVELNARIEKNKLIIISPPFYRTDLIAGEDVIEEIARLYGYDHLPKSLPVRRINPPEVNNKIALRRNIRNALVSAGANELLTYSFVDRRLLIQTGQDPNNCFSLANALSPELQFYRNLIIPSLLKKVHLNHKAGFESFCLFEMGKIHQKNLFDEDGLPSEAERLAVVISATPKFVKNNYQGPGFYQARAYLDRVLLSLGIDLSKIDFNPLLSLEINEFWQPLSAIYIPERTAVVSYNGLVLGLMGEFNSALTNDLKLPEFCAGFELDTNELLKLRPQNNVHYSQLSKFPKVIEDLTISVGVNLSYQQVRRSVIAKIAQNIKEDMNFNLSLIDIYQSDETLDIKNWTFRLEVDSYERTLTEKEVSSLVDCVKQSF